MAHKTYRDVHIDVGPDLDLGCHSGCEREHGQKHVSPISDHDEHVYVGDMLSSSDDSDSAVAEESNTVGSSADSRSLHWHDSQSQSQSAASTHSPAPWSSEESSRPPSFTSSSFDPDFDFEQTRLASDTVTYAPHTTPAHAQPWRSGCCPDPSNFRDPAAAHRLIPNLYPYMSFKRDAYHDLYSCTQNCWLCPVSIAEGLRADPTEQVVARAADTARAILELAVRFATGCEAPFDPQAAVLLADMVLKRHASFKSPSLTHLEVSGREQAHAYTVAALAYLLLFRVTIGARPDRAQVLPADLKDTNLQHAFADAHSAVVLYGFRFPGALEVMEDILRTAARVGVSEEELRTDERTFALKEYRGLWRAYDLWRRVLEKVLADPGKYECARPGCGYRTMKAQLLRRCGGACAGKHMVGYCGRICQKLDWQNHKAVCGVRKLAAGSADCAAETQTCTQTANVEHTEQTDPCSA